MTPAFNFFITDFFFFFWPTKSCHFEKQREKSRVFLTEQEFGTEWFYHLPRHCETELTPLRERCPKRAWHNLLQVFTRKLTRVLSGCCALVSLLLPKHEKKNLS